MEHVIIMKTKRMDMVVIVIVHGLAMIALCPPLHVHLIAATMGRAMLKQENVIACHHGPAWHAMKLYNHAQIDAVAMVFVNTKQGIVYVIPHFAVLIVERLATFVQANAVDMDAAI